MTNAYTFIPKPTGTPYQNVNPQGKEQYDQSTIIYDDPNTFYDGVDAFAWTDVAKPSGESQIIISPGMATGLITPPTYSTEQIINISDWTKISKPTT